MRKILILNLFLLIFVEFSYSTKSVPTFIAYNFFEDNDVIYLTIFRDELISFNDGKINNDFLVFKSYDGGLSWIYWIDDEDENRFKYLKKLEDAKIIKFNGTEYKIDGKEQVEYFSKNKKWEKIWHIPFDRRIFIEKYNKNTNLGPRRTLIGPYDMIFVKNYNHLIISIGTEGLLVIDKENRVRQLDISGFMDIKPLKCSNLKKYIEVISIDFYIVFLILFVTFQIMVNLFLVKRTDKNLSIINVFTWLSIVSILIFYFFLLPILHIITIFDNQKFIIIFLMLLVINIVNSLIWFIFITKMGKFKILFNLVLFVFLMNLIDILFFLLIMYLWFTGFIYSYILSLFIILIVVVTFNCCIYKYNNKICRSSI